MKIRNVFLEEISNLINIDYIGNNYLINGLNLCNRETEYENIISYITSANFFEIVQKNKAIKALFLTEKLYEEIIEYINKDEMSFFIVDNPEITFYTLHHKLWYETDFYDKYNFESIIGKGCDIHPSVVIENGIIVGDFVSIGPNSVLRRGSIIENNVQIGCCTVIGSEGFQAIKGFTKIIKHVGGTHICKDVCVGDNCTIGNALFEGYTYIGENTKFDNHVHFAHNCNCGKNCVFTASALLMGSVTIGDDVWLAPNSVILNNKIIENNAFIGTLSFVNKNVDANSTVVGIPAKKIPNK